MLVWGPSQEYLSSPSSLYFQNTSFSYWIFSSYTWIACLEYLSDTVEHRRRQLQLYLDLLLDPCSPWQHGNSSLPQHHTFSLSAHWEPGDILTSSSWQTLQSLAKFCRELFTLLTARLPLLPLITLLLNLITSLLNSSGHPSTSPSIARDHTRTYPSFGQGLDVSEVVSTWLWDLQKISNNGVGLSFVEVSPPDGDPDLLWCRQRLPVDCRLYLVTRRPLDGTVALTVGVQTFVARVHSSRKQRCWR